MPQVPGYILVVEDDDNAREMIKRALEKDGWQVGVAENGREAMQSVSRQLPDLILLDLMMPELDGFGVVEELQKHDDWRDVPVVVLTAKQLSPAERLRLYGHVEGVVEKGSYDRTQLLEFASAPLGQMARGAKKVERVEG